VDLLLLQRRWFSVVSRIVFITIVQMPFLFRSYYTSITIHTLLQEGILGQERRISGPPEGSKINNVSWSPDDRHVAFTIREADKVKQTEL
jgi:hypothetical protein